MLMFLLGFIGLGAAAGGAGGGGSSSKSDVKTVAVGPETVADDDPAPVDQGSDDDVMPDHDGMDHGSDDDDDMAHDDMDHGSDDDDVMPDHGDMDHGSDDDDMMSDHDDMDHGTDDDMAHDDHDHHDGHDDTPVVLPVTQAEIDAFVAAVRSAPESHSHEHGSSMESEHMAAMDLVARDEATHIAIGNGDWDNPANWHNGMVPGDNAKVLIPDGVHMTYDHMSDARLFTVRVDGKLEFATDVNSQMVVDTFVVSSSGTLEIGTAENPVAADVDVDIIFANNGAIDTDWDPMLLSRGLIAHGKVEIHGTEKDSHDKVVDDPMAGDTWIDMGGIPQGWAVGDTIVIAGTHYEGYVSWYEEEGYVPPEDEVRVITDIKDGLIFFDDPLIYDHDTPRDDLKTSVANYTRNVSFETEDAEDAEIYERGHVMFMHNDDVDVRYAEFHELGRTDKSEPAFNVSEFDDIAFDSNVKGRYSFHFHRAGTGGEEDDPGIAVGNAVYGSPGWGFVHHDSHAIFDNNATYDTFGAGYVAESGNETGSWNDNIAIYAQGVTWKGVKWANSVENFDMGRSGDGFWFQGRMVDSTNNIAASVSNGFVYFHRGIIGENGQIAFDAEDTEIPGVLQYQDNILPDDHPILSFSGNEVQAAHIGVTVVKANTDQGHDVHTVLEDFTAWNVNEGADLSYTAHYVLKDFDLIANEKEWGDYWVPTGIGFGNNVSDISIVDSTFEGFQYGIRLTKAFTTGDTPEDHEFFIVNPTMIDVDTEYLAFDPALDTILDTEDIPYLTPDIELDGPLTYDGQTIEITGTKSDSLGQTDFPTGADDFTLRWGTPYRILEENGYYTDTSGGKYMMMDIYFSDRLTGDIYIEKHPVLLGSDFDTRGADYNGEQDLGVEGDPTIDSAILWATLTDGQLELTDEAIALEEERTEDELEEA